MLLRNLMMLVLVLALVSAIMMGGAAWFGQNTLMKLEEDRKPASSLIQSVTMIRNVQFDYLVSQENRSLIQWDILYNRAVNQAKELHYDDSITELKIERINKALETLRTLFKSAVYIPREPLTNYSLDTNKKFSLSYNLINQQSQNILDEASQIEKDIIGKEKRFRDHIYLVLIVIFIIIPVITFLSILILYRRIDKSLSGLEEGTRILGTGDLDHRIELAGNDEFAFLSNSFNTMIEDLKQVLISRDLLREEKQKAENANRSKSIFLANMSHELRSPLNAILGFSHLLRSDPYITPSQRNKLDIINSSGEHLLSIINNVLDMAKVESGRITANSHPFDLYHLIHGVYNLYSLHAKEKGLIFTLDIPSDIPRYVQSDDGKIRQILINLVSNAVKFTESGTITIRVLSYPVSPEKCQSDTQEKYHRSLILISVQDTGIGIPPGEMEKIFLPFEQSDSGKGRPDGTGLGLPISRKFAEILGGTLSVTSSGVHGDGSTFTLEIPILPVEQKFVSNINTRTPGRTSISSVREYKLLIVDDQKENRDLLTAFHENVGLQTQQVTSGEEALSWIREWNPDLIWLDIMMPGLKGDEIMKRIKEEMIDPPVFIAVTANAYDDQKNYYMDQGFDGFLKKPFTEQEIISILKYHLKIPFIDQEEDSSVSGLHSDIEESYYDFSALDSNLLNHLILNAENGNITQLTRDISIIRLKNPQVAEILQELLNNFEFSQMIALLQHKE